MTTFEGLFYWCVLFLGLKTFRFEPAKLKFCMCLGAAFILSVAAFQEDFKNGFQQRQSSVSKPFRDFGSWAVLYGF
jgi:hypothetical protein